jgi:hypothetical protein
MGLKGDGKSGDLKKMCWTRNQTTRRVFPKIVKPVPPVKDFKSLFTLEVYF